MALENLKPWDADEAMNAFGILFTNQAQQLFNTAYTEASDSTWQSKLHGDGSPQFKNLELNTFQTDSADEAWNLFYDSTNDYYKTLDLSSGNLIYFDIYATSVSEATLTDAANNVYCVKIGDGVWRLYSWNGSTDEAINRAFVQMFDDISGLGTTDINGVTGLTQLRCSESTYRDKKCRYLLAAHSASSITDRHAQIDLSGTDSNAAYVIGDKLVTNHATGGSNADLYSPIATLIHHIGVSTTLDHRDTSTIHTVAAGTCDGMKCRGTTDAGTGQTWSVRGTLIFDSSLSSSISTSGSAPVTVNYSSEINISASVPDTSTYPLTTSTLILKTTTSASASNSITAVNSDIDATSTIGLTVSYNGGSNYTSATLSEIARSANAGTGFWRKITITRTDNSKEDKITEEASVHSWY